MTIRLLHIWTKLSSSFWFVPSLMTVFALFLSFGMIAADEHTNAEFIDNLSWIYTNKPEGAREVLSTIAGSMITVAGVVFSITIVSLSLASSQFGPRLLRNFMRDRGNQIVLGTFIATYFYCLLILRTIRSGDETAFVPHLSVLVGVGLAVISLGVLIYFIHHVSESIQVNQVINRVNTDLENSITQMFPKKIGEPASAVEVPGPDFQHSGLQKTEIKSLKSGYLQAIDQEKIMRESTKSDGFTEVMVRPGDFIFQGQTLVIFFAAQACSEETRKDLENCFMLGAERSLEQDLLFPVHQLVEIALRALSPSVNDPFTAKSCLDRLSNGLCQMAERQEPSAFRKDEAGVIRVKAMPILFSEATEAAFNQIRLYAKSNPQLMLYFMERLHIVAHCLSTPAQKQTLLHQAEMTYADAQESMTDPHVKSQFTLLFTKVKEILALPNPGA